MKAFILQLIFGFLADFILSFYRKLKAALADNEGSLIRKAITVVKTLEETYGDEQGDAKRARAIEELKAHAREIGKDLRTSAADSLIQVALAHLEEGKEEVERVAKQELEKYLDKYGREWEVLTDRLLPERFAPYTKVEE